MKLVTLHHRGAPCLYNLGQCFAISKFTNPHKPDSPFYEANRTFNAILDFGSEESSYHVDETPEQIMAAVQPQQNPVQEFEHAPLIRHAFIERLQAKTGWGRNEVLTAFDGAVAEVVANS